MNTHLRNISTGLLAIATFSLAGCAVESQEDATSADDQSAPQALTVATIARSKTHVIDFVIYPTGNVAAIRETGKVEVDDAELARVMSGLEPGQSLADAYARLAGPNADTKISYCPIFGDCVRRTASLESGTLSPRQFKSLSYFSGKDAAGEYARITGYVSSTQGNYVGMSYRSY